MKPSTYTANLIASANGNNVSKNALEGAPANLHGVKAHNSVSVTERPHILMRRANRWSRRANH